MFLKTKDFCSVCHITWLVAIGLKDNALVTSLVEVICWLTRKKIKRGEHIQNKGKGSSTCTCKRFNLVKAHFLNQEPCNKENNGGKSSSQKIWHDSRLIFKQGTGWFGNNLHMIMSPKSSCWFDIIILFPDAKSTCTWKLNVVSDRTSVRHFL